MNFALCYLKRLSVELLDAQGKRGLDLYIDLFPFVGDYIIEQLPLSTTKNLAWCLFWEQLPWMYWVQTGPSSVNEVWKQQKKKKILLNQTVCSYFSAQSHLSEEAIQGSAGGGEERRLIISNNVWKLKLTCSNKTGCFPGLLLQLYSQRSPRGFRWVLFGSCLWPYNWKLKQGGFSLNKR